ncbi:protein YABBY 3-like [Anopheles albimanus]|uniref:protein YABBY 3-like n=1 Tax=Anopheles albimanus TaxID=7167 RepID=UPI00163FD29C|nr:protein YABBY 3-like [Anopheles albimanus]
MRFALLLLVVGAAVSEPHEGYFYPRPTPQCIPQVYTETVTDVRTETLNHFFTDVNTVYLTDYLTSTVVNPIYITSTEYSVSTVVVPRLEFLTETSTLIVQPSPVVEYVTETVFSTIVAQGDFGGVAQVAGPGNTYLPPFPPSPPSPPPPPPPPVPQLNPQLFNPAIQLQQPPAFGPPPQVSLPPALNHPVTHHPFGGFESVGSIGGQRSLGGEPIDLASVREFGGGVHTLPHVGALPPAFDQEGYRYKRKLSEKQPQPTTTSRDSSKTKSEREQASKA